MEDESEYLVTKRNGEDFGMADSLATKYITKDDFEPEIINSALSFLRQRKCPTSLAVSLARKVVQELAETSSVAAELQNGQQNENINKESAPIYNMEKLLSSVCSRLEDVTWNEQQTTNNGTVLSDASLLYHASVCAIKNGRRKMEDRYVVLTDVNTLYGLQGFPHHSFYGVFDGHAGADAASYGATYLHRNIVRHPAFSTDVEEAIVQGFLDTDKNLLARSEREGYKSGSTVVTCLVRGDSLYIAWLGDSQAIVVRNGQPVQVMVPHKPDREDERKRIEDLGGCVVYYGTWRVNGTLAVSRALGDIEYKPFVSAHPEVERVPLDGSEDFVILACDGLWDVLQPEEVTYIVYSYMVQNPGDTEGISQKLVQVAKEKGSNDNITVLVVFLNEQINPQTHLNNMAFENLTSNANNLNHVSSNPFDSQANREDPPSLVDFVSTFSPHLANISGAEGSVDFFAAQLNANRSSFPFKGEGDENSPIKERNLDFAASTNPFGTFAADNVNTEVRDLTDGFSSLNFSKESGDGSSASAVASPTLLAFQSAPTPPIEEASQFFEQISKDIQDTPAENPFNPFQQNPVDLLESQNVSFPSLADISQPDIFQSPPPAADSSNDRSVNESESEYSGDVYDSIRADSSYSVVSETGNADAYSSEANHMEEQNSSVPVEDIQDEEISSTFTPTNEAGQVQIPDVISSTEPSTDNLIDDPTYPDSPITPNEAASLINSQSSVDLLPTSSVTLSPAAQSPVDLLQSSPLDFQTSEHPIDLIPTSTVNPEFETLQTSPVPLYQADSNFDLLGNTEEISTTETVSQVTQPESKQDFSEPISDIISSSQMQFVEQVPDVASVTKDLQNLDINPFVDQIENQEIPPLSSPVIQEKMIIDEVEYQENLDVLAPEKVTDTVVEVIPETGNDVAALLDSVENEEASSSLLDISQPDVTVESSVSPKQTAVSNLQLPPSMADLLDSSCEAVSPEVAVGAIPDSAPVAEDVVDDESDDGDDWSYFQVKQGEAAAKKPTEPQNVAEKDAKKLPKPASATNKPEAAKKEAPKSAPAAGKTTATARTAGLASKTAASKPAASKDVKSAAPAARSAIAARTTSAASKPGDLKPKTTVAAAKRPATAPAAKPMLGASAARATTTNATRTAASATKTTASTLDASPAKPRSTPPTSRVKALEKPLATSSPQRSLASKAIPSDTVDNKVKDSKATASKPLPARPATTIGIRKLPTKPAEPSKNPVAAKTTGSSLASKQTKDSVNKQISSGVTKPPARPAAKPETKPLSAKPQSATAKPATATKDRSPIKKPTSAPAARTAAGLNKAPATATSATLKRKPASAATTAKTASKSATNTAVAAKEQDPNEAKEKGALDEVAKEGSACSPTEINGAPIEDVGLPLGKELKILPPPHLDESANNAV